MIPSGNRSRVSILIVVCLAMFLPGLWRIPPIDRDESRFAQATAQMLEMGDYIDIRFQETPRYKKPVGIYWLQAASVSLLSNPEARQIWAYRLPSVLGALIAVLLTYWTGVKLFDRQTAFVGALSLACCFTLVFEAHQAKTDAVLLATIVAAQAALAQIYLSARNGDACGLPIVLCFWASLALGFLIKGPIGPMVSALTIGTLSIADRDRHWLRRLRPIPGLILFAVIITPWAVAVMQKTGGQFFETALTEDLLPKLVGGQESHGAPPGYHLLLLTLTFWPASLVVFPALAAAWKNRIDVAVRFCLAWIIPAWIVFEATPTKLPHYVLPVFPALALLSAHFVSRFQTGSPTGIWARVAYSLWALIGITLGGALLFATEVYGGGIGFWSLLAALLVTVASFWGLALSWRGRPASALFFAIPSGGAVLVIGYMVILPGLDSLWLSHQAALAAGPGRVVSDFREPSLVFLRGTQTLHTDAKGMATALANGEARVAIVTDRQLPEFRLASGNEGLILRETAKLRGFNYSRGKTRTLYVFEK